MELGQKLKREKPAAQKELFQARKDLLDAQDLAATLFESNTSQAQQILDLQDLVAGLVEKGGVA